MEDNTERKWKGVPNVSSFDSIYDANQNMTLHEFKEAYKTSYIENVTYKSTDSKYYDHFNDFTLRPKDNKENIEDKVGPYEVQMENFTLQKKELQLFLKNGFVVRNPPKHGWNFSATYLEIFKNDLPVFISSDSILHAFHANYEFIMNILEVYYFSQILENIIEGMLENLKELYEILDTNGPLRKCCEDVDLFLTTTLSLLTSTPCSPIFGSNNGSSIVQAVLNYKVTEINIFGKERQIDFSKFRPTARYTTQKELTHYFHAMMWCSIELEIGGEEMNERELGAAVVLYTVLTLSQKGNTNVPNLETIWNQFNSFLESIIGFSNCVNFLQFGNILHSTSKFKNVNGMNSTSALLALHDSILQKEELKREYNAKDEYSRSFAIMGRRFTIDNWATSKVTGKSIQRNNQVRRRTSGVDVAFSVLKNDSAVSIISSRIEDSSANNFRDGVPIQANIDATRKVIDGLSEEQWNSSLYMSWLGVLRTLSSPFDGNAPQSMKTEAYAIKMLNTQLGSWAQLRHANTLYVDEDEDDSFSCSYPDAYVEPVPQFWEAMEEMTRRFSASIQLLSVPELKQRPKWGHERLPKDKLVEFFKRFSKYMCNLKEISMAQLESIELTEEQEKFVKGLIVKNNTCCGLGDLDGWYYELFFPYNGGIGLQDAVVSGVFSSKPMLQLSDAGSVLHAGVGQHKLLLICVDKGTETKMYAGPVFNYKELDLPFGTRLGDEGWIQNGSKIPPPRWTSLYQVDKTQSDIGEVMYNIQQQQKISSRRSQAIASRPQTPPEEEPENQMGFSLFD